MDILILFMAVSLDIAIGEYPSKWHPTVWLGNCFNCFININNRENKWLLFFKGMILEVLYLFFVAAIFYSLLNVFKTFDVYFYLFLSAYLLKSTFSIRHFLKCIKAVNSDLINNDIDLARDDLRNLVSRDRSKLSEKEVIEAAIASAGENLNDGIIAPIFYYVFLGVPGALIYRTINSIDAMVGYRNEKYEYFGKFAARLDDVINFVPARITAILILVSSLFVKNSSSYNALNIMFRDNAKTPSINGGWPMAALAGALKIRINKPGLYSIGDDIEKALPEKILIANRFVVLSTAIFLLICVVSLQWN